MEESKNEVVGAALKLKIEAILFAGSRKFEIDDLAVLCRTDKKEIKKAISELIKDYLARDTSIMLVEEGTAYKLTVKEEFIDIIRNIVAETELTKSVMETLAVIAFKHPVLQADLIKIRTNKAYDHLAELENAGFIIREKFGRTKKIKLTQKFFDYFDLPPEKLKNAFESFEAVEKAIEQKEYEIKGASEELSIKLKEAEEKAREAAKVELYGEGEIPKIESDSKITKVDAPLGDLEVVDVPEDEISDTPSAKLVDEKDIPSDSGSEKEENEEKEEDPEIKRQEDEAADRLLEEIDKRADEIMRNTEEISKQLKDPVQSDDKGDSKKSELDDAYEAIEDAKDKLFKRKDVSS